MYQTAAKVTHCPEPLDSRSDVQYSTPRDRDFTKPLPAKRDGQALSKARLERAAE